MNDHLDNGDHLRGFCRAFVVSLILWAMIIGVTTWLMI